MAGPGICRLCQADTCASLVHPVFNPVAPYRYLLPNLHLFVEDIANPDLFVCGCRTCICLDISRFYEEQCQPSIRSAFPKKDKSSSPLLRAGGFDTICTAVCHNFCHSSTTRRLCRLEHVVVVYPILPA